MKSLYKKIFVIVSVVLVVVIGGVIAMTYFMRVDSPLVMTIRKTFHLPAIIVDGHNISMIELEENTASIKHFYENQDFSKLGVRIDFNTDDGKKRLMLEEQKMINKLIEDIAIEDLAAEWDIEVSDEAVQIAMERPMSEMGTKDEVEKKLKDLYGWTLDDFGKKVVRKQLLKEKVSAKFEQENPITDDMIQKIQVAKKELDDNRTFADVVKKYSEGSTANKGGVMGWFADGQVQDEIGKQIFTMEKGQYTDVIETPLGLHIVHIDDVSETDEEKLVHISQIVIKKQTFADFLDEKIKKMHVKLFIPKYEWDTNSAMIVFVDDEMKQFEEKILKESMEMQQKTVEKEN